MKNKKIIEDIKKLIAAGELLKEGAIKCSHDEEVDIWDNLIETLMIDYDILEEDIESINFDIPDIYPVDTMTEEEKKEYLKKCNEEHDEMINKRNIEINEAFYKKFNISSKYSLEYLFENVKGCENTYNEFREEYLNIDKFI